MPLTPNGRAPYTSAAAATTAIDAFRNKAMGTPITADVLIRAGVPETIAKRTLNSLVELELLDEAGQPTPAFEAFRTIRDDEDYRLHVQDWLTNVYADILTYVNPTFAHSDKVQGAFRGYEPAGQRPAMAALLLGLWQYAGFHVAEDDGSKASRSTKQSTRRSVPGRGGKSKQVTETLPPTSKVSAAKGILMAVTDDDIAAMSADEFSEVWAALGKVALARARRLKPPTAGDSEVSAEQEDSS